MAPESDPDARSDQYSLAASFAELVGGAPAIRDPGRLAVPNRIRAAIARALRPDPAQRFRSIDELTAALIDRQPPRFAAPIALGSVAIAAGMVAMVAGHKQSPCEATPVVWTADERNAVIAAFDASPRSFALDTRRRVMPRLDAFAATWVHERASVCEAYHERHEISDQRFDVTVSCLDRQRQLFAATFELLRSGATGPIDKAVDLATSLPSLDECRNSDDLARIDPLPVDPVKRAQIIVLDKQLAEAKVRQRGGDPARARQLAQGALASARTTGYRPGIANAAYRLADLLERSGDAAHAMPLAQEAIRVAAEARLDSTEAASWILQLMLRGVDGDARDAELAAAQRAGEAAAARARDPKMQAELDNVLGLIAKNHGDYAGARDSFQRSLDLLKASHLDGPEAPVALRNLSTVLPMLGDLAGARHAAEEVLNRDREMFGAAHPAYANSLLRLSACESDLGDFVAATKHQLDALKIIDATIGDDSPDAMIVHNNLASSLAQDHHLDDAMHHAERALALAQKLRGPKHPATAQALFTVANVAGEAGDWARADEYAHRALAIAVELYGPEHQMSAAIIGNLGEWALRRGEFKPAEGYLRKGVAAMHANPKSPAAATLRTGLGAALEAQGKHGEAITELEAALALRIQIGDDPVAVGDTQSWLARALWATGNRARAIELAHAAGAAFAKAGEAGSRFAKDLNTWRTTNHVP
jgi:tetratricopeptide (TPR) repeat protein